MPGTYSLAFWNLENLFAPEGYAQREPWIAERMRSELAGWTEALFERKLEQLASLIVRLNGGNGPALLDVCEVEKRFALERLASAWSHRCLRATTHWCTPMPSATSAASAPLFSTTAAGSAPIPRWSFRTGDAADGDP